MKRPITPPCHGGDRRFESGRARQKKRLTDGGSFFLACLQALNRRSANTVSVDRLLGGARTRAGACTEHAAAEKA